MYFIRIIFNKIIFYKHFIKVHFFISFTMTSKDQKLFYWKSLFFIFKFDKYHMLKCEWLVEKIDVS